MSILYANPGYYQFLPCHITTRCQNNTVSTKSNTGICLELAQFDEYPLFWNKMIDYTKVFMNFDIRNVYPLMNTKKKMDNFASHPIIYVTTSSTLYPRIEFRQKIDDNTHDLKYQIIVIKNDGLEINLFETKDNLYSNLRNRLYNMKINFNIETPKASIKMIFNNDSNFSYSVDDMIYLFDASGPVFIKNVYICGSATDDNILTKEEVMDFSDILVADEDLTDVHCIDLPIEMNYSDWGITTGDLYNSSKDKDLIKYHIDMNQFKDKYTFYDNTEIKGIFFGGDIAYSDGANELIFYVNKNKVDRKQLALNDKYGCISKILEVNPVTNDTWTREEMEDLIFTIENHVKG